MSRAKGIQWYLHRLRAMPVGEVRRRLEEQVITLRERRQYTRIAPLNGHQTFSTEAYEHLFRDRSIRFFFSREEIESLRTHWQTSFPTEVRATLSEAERLLQNQITLFHHSFNLTNPNSWQRDPCTGNEWPPLFWADVDTRDGQTIGGVKWVWELNRHHHLVTLAKAYFLTQEERYAETVCTQLAGWIDTNPPLTGVNWTSSLELAIRLINWTWALAFIRQSPALDEALSGKILHSVATQAAYITRHHTAFSSANNHLIGEAAGLAVVGLCFPWLPAADKWRRSGLQILARELERQIHPDGVPAEQAISYLPFILDFNLIAWRLAELNGHPVPSIWYQRLGAAADFIAHLMDECGHIPTIGDADDASVIRLDAHPQANNFRSIVATAAILLNRPALKASAGRWDEKSHWLLGAQGYSRYQSLPATEKTTPGSRIFAAGGYSVMRAPYRVLTFDCGPLGYLSIAAHGHADALSLTLSAGGRPLLIDPGTFAYQEDGQWRDYFRSTAAHNTVVVDGQNQSEMLGPFLWGRKATTRLLAWHSTPGYDFAAAEHDGYAQLGVSHRRSVLFLHPDWIIVADSLQGSGEHYLEQLWHLGPECEAKLDNSAAIINCRAEPAPKTRITNHESWMMDDLRWRILPIGDITAATVAMIRAETSPIQGWYSPAYGLKQPATAISRSGWFNLPARLLSAIHLGEDGPGQREQQARALALLNHLEEEKLC